MRDKDKKIIKIEKPKEGYYQEDENKKMFSQEIIDNPDYKAADRLKG